MKTTFNSSVLISGSHTHTHTHTHPDGSRLSTAVYRILRRPARLHSLPWHSALCYSGLRQTVWHPLSSPCFSFIHHVRSSTASMDGPGDVRPFLPLASFARVFLSDLLYRHNRCSGAALPEGLHISGVTIGGGGIVSCASSCSSTRASIPRAGMIHWHIALSA